MGCLRLLRRPRPPERLSGVCSLVVRDPTSLTAVEVEPGAALGNRADIVGEIGTTTGATGEARSVGVGQPVEEFVERADLE